MNGKTTPPNTDKEVDEASKRCVAIIAENLEDCCKDILKWHKTGELPNDSFVRKAAKEIEMGSLQTLQIVESLVAEYSMEFVVKHMRLVKEYTE